MDFAALPPEVNSIRMYSGAGPAPILAAATAWQTLAGQLHATGTGYEATIAELADTWSGPSAAAMTAAATPYACWMHDIAVQAEQTAAQAKAAALAYEAAYAMTVPPAEVAANRAALTTLLATNHLGQNTAAIAATEAQYAQMWAQDAAAMYHYAGNAATASILKPFGPPPQTTNPAGTATQTGAVGQATAGAAAGQVHNTVGQLAAVPSALQALTSPAASSGALGALPPSLAADPGLTLAYLGLASSLFGTFVIDSAGTFGVDVAGSFGIDLIGVGEIGEALVPPLSSGLPEWSAPVSAGLGQAARVGALSVPQAWTAAAPAVPYSSTVAPTGAATGSTVAAIPFAEMATAGVAGRAIAAAGRTRGPGAATGPPGASSPTAPKTGPITVIADELRELSALRDEGILTEDEFTEQKRRLLEPGH